MAEKEALNKRERLNRNMMILIGIIGAVIGTTLAFVSPQDSDISFRGLSNTPISQSLAIVLAIFWAGVMPIIIFCWEKSAIDEQEAAAYRTGAYYAAYALSAGAPTWWILWRGGLTPEPNGMAIFCIFNFIWLITWLWKKYRG